jgi:hypothetical protein
MAEMDDRKKRIMEHIARSTNGYTMAQSVRSSDRKQRILDHVRRTIG